jgi:hypothetical protein
MEFQRQKNIFDPSKHKETISIVGCGSVGSFAALALAKMGCNVTEVYDSDRIESHNLPNQFYAKAQLGNYKNKSIKELLSFYTDSNPNINENVVEKQVFNTEIVVSAVDSMSARKMIWNNVKASKNVKFYVDSRMGGKIFSLFSVRMNNKKDIQHYEQNLVSDSETTELRCTERTIIFNVLGLASFICNNISNFLNKKNVVSEIHFDYFNLDIVKLDWI